MVHECPPPPYLATRREVPVRKSADAPQPRGVWDRLPPLRSPPDDTPPALVNAHGLPAVTGQNAPLPKGVETPTPSER